MAIRAFNKSSLEEKINEEFAFKVDFAEAGQLLVKQDDDAKHVLIMSCWGSTFAIFELRDMVFKMYHA